MKKELSRGEKLCYGFLLAGCFLTVMTVDDSPEQAELSRQHKEWVIEQAQSEIRKAEQERFYRVHPASVYAPAFSGKPNWDNQFAMLRAEHERKK